MRYLSKKVSSRRSRKFQSEWLGRHDTERLETRSMAGAVFTATTPFGDGDGNNVMAMSGSSVFDAQDNILVQQAQTVDGEGGAGSSSAVSGTVIPGRITGMGGQRGPAQVTATEQGIVNTTLGAPVPGGGTSSSIQIVTSHLHIDTVTAGPDGPYNVVGFPNWGQVTHVQSLPSGNATAPYDLNWTISAADTLTWTFTVNMEPPSDPRFAEFLQLGVETSIADVNINNGSPGLWVTPPGVGPGNPNTAYAHDTNFGFGSVNDQNFTFSMQVSVGAATAVGVSYYSTLYSAPGQAGVVGSQQPPVFSNETAGSTPGVGWTLAMTLK
jgi:hypothetical protein